MIVLLGGLAGLSALLCAGLTLALFPLLKRYALARPNARSSHIVPTPQGAGIAVVLTLVMLYVGCVSYLKASLALDDALLLGAALLLGVTGLVDDLRPLPALPRLGLQFLAVGALVYGVLPAHFATSRLFPEIIPLEVERIVLMVAGVWCVNLTNFMDGLDGMSVAEFVPVGFALAFFFFLLGDALGALMSASLAGAMIGFAFFNRPPAKVFLGDVGSLPLGLLLFFLLYRVALHGHWLPALILPLYYLMDATLTLLKRIMRREPIWQAHRTHFYQQATDNGWSALGVGAAVFVLNIVLGIIAFYALFVRGYVFQTAMGLGALTMVVGVLIWFSRPKALP
jgi:UDP-N-acetylmuramyl pentapeptide phosphotransferase/UDP-N-acetylglucosamine-1-phosphate transferase